MSAEGLREGLRERLHAGLHRPAQCLHPDDLDACRFWVEAGRLEPVVAALLTAERESGYNAGYLDAVTLIAAPLRGRADALQRQVDAARALRSRPAPYALTDEAGRVWSAGYAAAFDDLHATLSRTATEEAGR